eukprot:CAMPEP_0180058294 /NCGR_PEP_ID=MMETSP0985-20121206/4940_1 /TAXON_ID=483367 /ORGANISM="non described non described, Strain CCMP 2436" /LENGTH=781 /DNA_ID=CAMNT_0021988257 /DNA_START=688 /DNA_END=3035 /DNA_ORIENTATION=-
MSDGARAAPTDGAHDTGGRDTILFMAERLKLDMDDIRATLKLFVLVLEDDPSVLWTGGQGSGEILGWGYYELPFGLLAHVLGGDGPVAQLEENSAREKTRWGSAAGARRQRAAECADRLRRQLEQEAAEEAEWAWQCERNVAAAEEAAEKTAEEEADAQGATPPPVAAPLSRGHRRKVLRVADGDEPMTCEGAAEAVDAAAAPAADDDDEGDDVLSGGARRRRKAEHARQVAALDGLAARPTADSLAEYGAPVVEERLKRLGLATVAPGDQRARRSIASENVRAPAEARCDAYVERTITFFETLRPGAELVAASALDFALTADDYSLLSVKLLARILHGRCLGHLAPGALAMCLPKLAGQTRAWLAQRIVDPALADGFAEARIEPVSGWRCGRNLNLRAEREGGSCIRSEECGRTPLAAAVTGLLARGMRGPAKAQSVRSSCKKCIQRMLRWAARLAAAAAATNSAGALNAPLRRASGGQRRRGNGGGGAQKIGLSGYALRALDVARVRGRARAAPRPGRRGTWVRAGPALSLHVGQRAAQRALVRRERVGEEHAQGPAHGRVVARSRRRLGDVVASISKTLLTLLAQADEPEVVLLRGREERPSHEHPLVVADPEATIAEADVVEEEHEQVALLEGRGAPPKSLNTCSCRRSEVSFDTTSHSRDISEKSRFLDLVDPSSSASSTGWSTLSVGRPPCLTSTSIATDAARMYRAAASARAGDERREHLAQRAPVRDALLEQLAHVRGHLARVLDPYALAHRLGEKHLMQERAELPHHLRVRR